MKTKILVAIIITISFIGNSSYGRSNNAIEEKKDMLSGKWEMIVSPEGMGEMTSIISISKKGDAPYSGNFSMMGDQTEMTDIKFNAQTGNFSFKADMGFAILSFDLQIADNKISGKVNSSDGIKGDVSGKRPENDVAIENVKMSADGLSGKWKANLDVEGMGKMPATMLISKSDDISAYVGEFRLMGDRLEMIDFKFNKQDGSLSFSIDLEEFILNFNLLVSETKIEGKLSSIEGVSGTVSGEYLGVITPPKPYKPTVMTENIEEMYLEDGNTESNTVLMIIQGGPIEKVQKWPFFDGWKEDLHIVYVRQAQDLNPTLWDAPDLSFENAYDENLVSVEMIDRSIKHFHTQGKKVIMWGGSYAVFLIEEYLAQKGFTPDAACVSAGRLDIEKEMWEATRDLKTMEYVYKKGKIKIKDSGEKGHRAECYLQSSLGRHRYTERLSKLDLTKLVYQYGEADPVIGALDQKEINFLNQKGATVIGYPGADHGDAMSVENINFAIKKMLELISE